LSFVVKKSVPEACSISDNDDDEDDNDHDDDLSSEKAYHRIRDEVLNEISLKVTPYDENIDFVLFYIFIDLYRGARDLSVSANIF
jgi:hypothetical protein